jgi:hypothetical protein
LASDTETLGDADGLMQQHHHILLLHQRRQARGLSGPSLGGAGIGLQVIFFIFFQLKSHIVLMSNYSMLSSKFFNI